MATARKPLIWALVLVVVLLGAVVTTVVTSTRWFCTSNCHNVLADAVQANTLSPHAQTQCASCHLPSPADFVSYASDKIAGLGDVTSQLSGKYTLPLNREDALAFSMPSSRCVACHNQPLSTFKASDGRRINHQRHADRGVGCTICHNRTGHSESDFELTLLDPKLKAVNWKHADFMKMAACFRCHTQETVKGAPTGACLACHTRGFTLRPESHSASDFAKEGHAKLASRAESLTPWHSAGKEPAMKTIVATSGATKWSADNLASLRKPSQINECSICHPKRFCSDCHGLPMPHPSGFEKTHGELSQSSGGLCTKCHAGGAAFCGECHHAQRFGRAPGAAGDWKAVHRKVAKDAGKDKCTRPGGCHSPVYCAKCHVNEGTLPPDAPRW